MAENRRNVDIVIRARQEGMENVVKAAGGVYLLKEAFSATAGIMRQANPELAKSLDNVSRIVALSKVMSGGRGGFMGLAGGALGAGLAVWSATVQAQGDAAEKLKAYNAEMKALDDLYSVTGASMNRFYAITRSGHDATIERLAAQRAAHEATLKAIYTEPGGFLGKAARGGGFLSRWAMTGEDPRRHQQIDADREAAAMAAINRNIGLQQAAKRVEIERTVGDELDDAARTADEKRYHAVEARYAAHFARLRAVGLEGTALWQRAVTSRDVELMQARLAATKAAADRAPLAAVESRFLSGGGMYAQAAPANPTARLEDLGTRQLKLLEELRRLVGGAAGRVGAPPVMLTAN